MWKGSPEEREGRKQEPSWLRECHHGWPRASSPRSGLLTDAAKVKHPGSRRPLGTSARQEADSDTSISTADSGLLVGPVACGVLLQLLFVNQQNLPCGRGWIRETKTSFASKLKKLLRNTTWTGREIKCKIEPSCHRSVNSCSVDDFCARDSEKPCPHMERQGDPTDPYST